MFREFNNLSQEQFGQKLNVDTKNRLKKFLQINAVYKLLPFTVLKNEKSSII